MFLDTVRHGIVQVIRHETKSEASSKFFSLLLNFSDRLSSIDSCTFYIFDLFNLSNRLDKSKIMATEVGDRKVTSDLAIICVLGTGSHLPPSTPL